MGSVSGCPACDAGQGCGAGIFGRLLRNRRVDVRIENRIKAVPGQAVKIGIGEHSFLGLVFRLYVWPLIAGLLGVIIGFVIATYVGVTGLYADLTGLVTGVASGGLAMLLSRRQLREFPYRDEVHLIEVVHSPAAGSCTMGTEAGSDRGIPAVVLDD